MKKKNSYLFLSIFLIAFLLSENVYGQAEVLKPILLNKEILSGIGLDTIKLKNEPERDFFQKRLYRGKEISVYVVSSESWISKFDAFWFDEFIYILNGKARIKSHGTEHHFYSEEFIFAPKGFPGEWEVQAGKHYHYELSVITNQRVNSTATDSIEHPMILDQLKTSGLDIAFDEDGLYQEDLAKGVELTISIHAEKPRDFEIIEGAKEQMIRVLSGQLSIQDLEGENQAFYSGDFFVLPHGFKGNWKSEGHGMVKYISVKKTE